MTRMKKFLSLLLAMVLVLALAACSSGSGQTPAATASPQKPDTESQAAVGEEHEPVTLTIVHEHSEEAAENIVTSAAFRYCMDKYKQDHPWVTLEETIVANSDIINKYLTMVAGDDLPDITYVKYTWLESTAGNGMLVDLTEYADPSKYYDGLASTTYDGKIYGLENKYTMYNLICYNTALWEQAGLELPTSFEELIAADATFDAMGIDTISLGNTAKWFAVSYFTDALYYDVCGADWTDKAIRGDKSIDWTDPKSVEALTKLQSMKDIFNADFNMTDDVSAAAAYMQGKAACHVVGSWGISTLEGLAKDYPEVWKNTRVAIVPAANGAQPTLINASGAAMGVSARLQEPGKEAELQAAIEFVQYISSDDYAKYCAEHGTTTPVKTTFDWSDKDQPYVDFANVMESAKATGLNFNDYVNDTVKIVIQNESQSLLAGATTPEAAAANIQAAQQQVWDQE